MKHLYLSSLMLIILLSGCMLQIGENEVVNEMEFIYLDKLFEHNHIELIKSNNKLDEGISIHNIGLINKYLADIFEEPQLTSKRLTQGLLSQPVYILERASNWSKVIVSDGTIGWTKNNNISENVSEVLFKNVLFKIVVSSNSKSIVSSLKEGIEIEDAVMGTELYVLDEYKGYLEVVLPTGVTGWTKSSGVIKIDLGNNIIKSSVEDFIITINRFIDNKFLLGGVSSLEGFDSSGLVYSTCLINGLKVPRSIIEQYNMCYSNSDINKISEGDIVFFKRNSDDVKPSFVGVYINNGNFIFSDIRAGKVRVESLNNEYYSQRFIGSGSIWGDKVIK